MRAMLLERIVLSNKVEKKAGPITKAGRGVVRSVSGAGDQKIKGADRSRRGFQMPCRAKFMLHLGASRRSCLPRVARTASSFTAVSLAPAAPHLASRPGAAGGFRARAWQVRRLIAVVRGSSPTRFQSHPALRFDRLFAGRRFGLLQFCGILTNTYLR